MLDTLKSFFPTFQNSGGSEKELIQSLQQKNSLELIIKKFEDLENTGFLTYSEDEAHLHKIFLKFNIKSKSYIVAYAWIDCKKNNKALLINEILTTNYQNWKHYSSKVEAILNLHLVKADILPEKLSLKYKDKLRYISVFLLYKLVQKAKSMGKQEIKIIGPLDEVCKYYYQVADLFQRNKLIKKFTLPQYETIEENKYFTQSMKVIMWYL